MSQNTYMIVGLALYACFVLYVGFIGAKKIKGLSDFAVAGESMGPIPLGLAFAASFFSAATFMGYVGYCYAWGTTGLWIFLAIFTASTLGFILLAKGIRNSNATLKSISMADWLAKNYNSDVLRGLVSIVFIIQIFYIAGQFSAGGSLLSGMIDGLEYTPAIIAVTVITVLYVTVGGLFADVYTSITNEIPSDGLAALDMLSSLTKTEITYPLKGIADRKVNFKDVIDTSEMLERVYDFAK